MKQNHLQKALILGSTGSVGSQSVDVALKCGVNVRGLSGCLNWQLAEQQVRATGAPAVAMANEEAAKALRLALSDTAVKVFAGNDGLLEMIAQSDADLSINAILGEAGLMPSLTVLESGQDLALANKESIVVAGELVLQRARELGRRVIPVDSEHSAIAQSLRSGEHSEIKRLILTASGGPFFGKTSDELAKLTVKDAMAHPTWSMGAKITVDSATLMNKGFEIIEAAHLFGVDADRIDVVVHRESIIHSMVEYIDNSIIAQMSVPDMRACVQYALTAPVRTDAVTESLDLVSVGKLTFFAPDEKTFPLLGAARRAYRMGGAVPAALNAANEVAVSAFLEGRISLPQLFDAVLRVIDDMPHAVAAKTLSQILEIDREARERTATIL